jgi:hypothetical protein
MCGEPDEIEITPEMIAAGADVLLGEFGGAVTSHWFPDDLAKQVYRAMASHNPEGCRLSQRQTLRAKSRHCDTSGIRRVGSAPRVSLRAHARGHSKVLVRNPATHDRAVK